MNSRSLYFFVTTVALLCAGVILPASTKADDDAIEKALINASLKAITSDTPSAWEDVELLTGLDESKKVIMQSGGSVISDILDKRGDWPTNGPTLTRPAQLARARSLDPRIAKVVDMLGKAGAGRSFFRPLIEQSARTGPDTLRSVVAHASTELFAGVSESGRALREASELAWLFPEAVDILLSSPIPKNAIFKEAEYQPSDPINWLLNYYVEPTSDPKHPEYKGYHENSLKALKSLIAAGCPVSNDIQTAISKGYPLALGELLKGKPLPSKNTMIAWLISAKAQSTRIPQETFTVMKQMIESAGAPSPKVALPVEPKKTGQLPSLRAYFLAYDSVYGTEIWTTDGTEEGTHVLIDLEPGASSSNFGSLVATDHGVRFLARTVKAALRTYLCSETGEVQESTLLADQNTTAAYVSGTHLVTLVQAQEPGVGTTIQIDGSPEGTVNIPWEVSFGSSEFHQIGDRLFFHAVGDGGRGTAPAWLTEIQADQRKIIRHASWQWQDYPSKGAPPTMLSIFEPALKHVFLADESGLWASLAGSAAEPILLQSGLRAVFWKQKKTMAATGSTFFFVAKQTKADDAGRGLVDLYGEELFATDGTPEGTRMVKDINPVVDRVNPSNQSSHLSGLTAIGGTDRIVFAAEIVGDSKGCHLCVSDGTAKGTHSLFEDSSPDRPELPRGFVASGGKALFFDSSGLWATDGTTEGTKRIALLDGIEGMTDVGGTVLLNATDRKQKGVWRSDGTAEGTVFLRSITATHIDTEATFFVSPAASTAH